MKSRWNKNIALFLISQLCVNLAYGMQRVVFNNFLVDDIGVSGLQRGALESIREIPGSLAVFLAAVTAFMTESTLGGLCIFATSLGTFAFVFSRQYSDLILPILLMSTGIHMFMPIRSTMTLGLAQEGEKAKRLGQLGSITAIASLVASGIVFLTVDMLKYKGLFACSGAVALLGGVAMLFVSSEEHLKRQRFVVRRRYSFFYALTLLAGCRRQIFITFALYALVEIHGVDVKTISILMAFNNFLNIYARPKIGVLIDRLGERKMLIASYMALIFVFLGYGYVSFLPLLYILYCVDSLCFGFEVARTTYLDKIASREDVMPTLAFGITMNHVLAVGIPVVGGYLWDMYGYDKTFLMGVGILLLSISVAWRMDRVFSTS